MVIFDGVVIDASLRETHTYETEITSDPVEAGSNTSDNIINLPNGVVLECIVSDTPLGDIATIREQEQPTPDGELEFLPSEDVLARLLEIRKKRREINIETLLKRYDSMALETLQITKDEKTGAALRFSATFKFIEIVSNTRLVVKVSAPNGQGKKKFTGPPVVVIKNGPKKITTRNGYDAVWNPSKGRYEYENKKTGAPSGTVVPNSDLNDGLQSDSQPGPTAASQENSTYFDYQDDEWKNTDGTPVTKEQLAGNNGTSPTIGDRGTPWYAPEPGNAR